MEKVKLSWTAESISFLGNTFTFSKDISHIDAIWCGKTYKMHLNNGSIYKLKYVGGNIWKVKRLGLRVEH